MQLFLYIYSLFKVVQKILILYVLGNVPSLLSVTVVVSGNGPSVLMLHLFCLDVSRLEEVRVQPKPKVAMISE